MSAPRPVLLVEDDPVYRNSLARLLRHDGHEVLSAKDGDEALELLSNDLILAPWVIVTDLGMPGRSGAELIISLRSQPEFQHIPVIIITGMPSTERPEVAADHLLLLKPVTHLQLHDALCALAPKYGQPVPQR